MSKSLIFLDGQRHLFCEPTFLSSLGRRLAAVGASDFTHVDFEIARRLRGAQQREALNVTVFLTALCGHGYRSIKPRVRPSHGGIRRCV